MNPDSKISLQSLAAKLGLAKSTVSMGLRDDPRVSSATRDRIKEAASQFGYSADADIATMMARIQARSHAPYQSNLAVVPITETRVGLIQISGCVRRAKVLGYKVDLIRDCQSLFNPVQLLKARGIQGVIFVGWPFKEFSPDCSKLLQICDEFATSVIASKPPEPAINCVLSDALNCMQKAVHAVIELGYKRPAAFINGYLDGEHDQAYTGGFMASQLALPKKDRLPPEYFINDPAQSYAWIEKHKPDCILTHDSRLHGLLQSRQIKVPAEMGFIHLDLVGEALSNHFSGIDQNHNLIGEAAVDMVVAQIHRSERGIPAIRKCVSISGRWISGVTTRNAKNQQLNTKKIQSYAHL